MTNSNHDNENGVWPQTTFSVEDWEGAEPRSSAHDPLRILLAVADDATSNTAVMITGGLAQRQHVHPIAVHVLDLEAHLSTSATQHLAGTVQTLGGLPTRWPLDVEAGRPSDAILAAAHAFQANLIILGRHHAVTPVLSGDSSAARVKVHVAVNVPRRVMAAEEFPVFAIHRECLELPKRIVAAVDFHRASLCAVQMACTIAEPGSTIYLVHVYDGRADGTARGAASRERAGRGIGAALGKLKQLVEQREDITVKTVMLLGDPIVELHSFLHHIRPDLTAFGTRGDRVSQGHRLGPVATALLDDPCVSSVLVAPAAPKRRSGQ